MTAAALWAAAFASTAAPGGDAEPAHGQRLFAGTEPMRGRIAGHADALPALASRCVNCHAPGRSTVAAPAASAAAPTNTSFAPLLTPAYLTVPVARRGGPPSRYDEATFCRALRTGIDPAYVIVSRSMPRYDVNDADCRALWRHLTEAAR